MGGLIPLGDASRRTRSAPVVTILLIIVVLLATGHLGVVIAEDIWKPPRFLIPVEGLLEIFGYFLLVLIGVELLETLKVYANKDVVHVRVVLEVALRKACKRKTGTAQKKNSKKERRPFEPPSSFWIWNVRILIVA